MIILASGSPRRKELLGQMNLSFVILSSDADETPTKTIASEIVEELSLRKAEDVYNKLIENERLIDTEDNLIVAADTLVFYGNERLGKPGNRDNAVKMLNMLQGNTHQVFTGVTLILVSNKTVKKVSFHEKTDVTFYPMTEHEIDEYVATGEPMDKAGAYAIQGYCAKYIQSINGEYSNVVGLPVARLYHEMVKIGFIKP